MKKAFLVFILLFSVKQHVAQIRQTNSFGRKLTQQELDSVPSNEINVKLNGKTTYTDYKIISFDRDTTIVDTTLTVYKDYKFNFTRRDNFELLPFHNQGQTFNKLGYNFQKQHDFLDIGFKAKQFNYYDLKDVKYFEVPTPTSEIMYRTGLEQGQVLDGFFTTNFSRRFNIAVAYKGIRSLGHYRRSLVSSGNFRFSYNYKTPKEQYETRGHFTTQGFNHQENGGLTKKSLEAFITNDDNFKGNRGRMDVNLDDAESYLETERFYFEHALKLFSKKDTLNQKDFSNLKVGHSYTRQFKGYKFTQQTVTENFFGKANASAINDTVSFVLNDNQLFLDFNSKYVLGKFRVKTNYTTYKYGYDYLQNSINPSVNKRKLKGKAVSFGADWKANIGNFHLNAQAKVTSGKGRLSGHNFYGEAFYKKDSLFTLKGRLSVSSTSPNLNFILHQSAYNNYNWQNSFKNIDIRNIGGTFKSKWLNASLDITNINDYVFLNEQSLPSQYSGNINYLKVKASKHFTFGKFGFDNTVMYQKVANGKAVFRVPEFITRNTFYYSDNWFKGKPLLVNIGVTFKYFTKYKANAYNPLLAEFHIQNDTEIGYPTFDVFFNGRVRRTRIYFKVDNVTSSFTKRNYFSAPNYPYRDFTLRFGVVWNWFI